MTKPYDPSRPYRVTLDARGVEAASSPHPEQLTSSVQGPFPLSGFLAPFPDPVPPGENIEVAIYFPDPGQEPVRTVTAFATELSPPSTPWKGDATFLTHRVNFDQQNQVLVVGFSMAWGSPLHVAAMLMASKPVPIPNILGPFKVTDYVFFSTRPDQWVQPGFNSLTIDLRPLGIMPWTVSASVTELSPPSTPWQGDANFQTLGVQLNQPDRFATVFCDLEWPAPLPVAVMLTIGYT